jgi:phosphoenolpyruvate carboxylase
MPEITDEAREIAVRWGDNMKDDFISQKHKLASDIMNYARRYKQEEFFTTSQVEEILQNEFTKFHKEWHGVMNGSDLQTLAKFIQQVKEKINEPVTNPC